MLTLHVIHTIISHNHNPSINILPDYNDCPETYNKLPIMKKWSDIGGKPKIFNIVNYERFRLAECSTGYGLLCHDISCNNLSTCRTHKTYKESYTYCRVPNCNKRAYFGYEFKKSLLCSSHKLVDMINVKSKRCEHPGCTICPCYMKLFSTHRTHCREHSNLNEYSYTKRNPICTVINCQNAAHYIDHNDRNIYPVRCNDHKLNTDIELVHRQCSNCLDELYFPINREVCMNCGIYRERILYHFKEYIIKGFLQSNNIPFIHDKIISPNGSRYRPDFVIKGKYIYICLEVDEYQHSGEGYSVAKEQARMCTIYQDLQITNHSVSLLFLRYNPDRYNGINYDTKQRLSYLYTIIKYFMEIETIGMNLGKIYLYYDGFTGNPKIQPINSNIEQIYQDEPDYDNIDEDEDEDEVEIDEEDEISEINKSIVSVSIS